MVLRQGISLSKFKFRFMTHPIGGYKSKAEGRASSRWIVAIFHKDAKTVGAMRASCPHNLAAVGDVTTTLANIFDKCFVFICLKCSMTFFKMKWSKSEKNIEFGVGWF